ncbi:Asp-tRNA(Asn)/Glu-tRNA(Gln) amidotransferase subunit GatB [SAR86 cluster bacterium]|nr:Asp-tRNA(Asn)/Glu-tRNA(Gln) amidotransferase subunit GatB [SAR86 cluster bacterium]
MKWEAVIGLEAHVQLSTETKLFSRASTTFGDEANTNVNLVDCGLPGVLPTVNKNAFYKAVKFGLAIDASINKVSIFDRKNYFYPDLPKGYQITQMEKPILEGGSIEINIDGLKRKINITRAHLEEDAGKSIHEGFKGTGIDLNRSGTPLLEIVSEPELRSSQEAVAYMKELHKIVTFLDVSDGEMSQGSLRCDANVSIRQKGETELGTRTEIKNINSFKFIEKAIEYEIKRQIAVLESKEKVEQETRLYDSIKNETRPMRSKEFANDYRYFPEPDLLPVVITDKEINDIKKHFPEMPKEKSIRYVQEFGISESDSSIISNSKNLSNFFEDCIKIVNDKVLLAKILVGDISSLLNKDAKEITDTNFTPENITQLINLISDGTISGKIAKDVLDQIRLKNIEPYEYIKEKGLTQISDEDAIERIILEILAKNPEQVEAYNNGKDKLFGFFVGQVMKATQGKANPKSVNLILKKALSNKHT